jgi:hypothetical protein
LIDTLLQASALFAVANDFRGAAEASLESSDAATQHTPAALQKKAFSFAKKQQASTAPSHHIKHTYVHASST